MTSPTLELQAAIVTRLKTDPVVTAIVAGRVYDSVPANPVFPYISLGVADLVSDDVDCIDGFEISIQIDAWSRAVGFPEVRRIADAIRRALHTGEIALADNALVSFRHRVTREMRNPDGLTSHAAVTFEAFAEQP